MDEQRPQESLLEQTETFSAHTTLPCPKGRAAGDWSQRLLRDLSSILGVEGGSFYVRRDDNLALVGTIEPAHQPETLTIPPVPGSVFDHAFATSSTVYVRNDPPAQSGGWSGYRQPGLMVIKLRDAEGNLGGVISLHNKRRPPFSDQDREVGRLMGDVAERWLQERAAQTQVEALTSANDRLRTLLEQGERLRSLGELATGLAHDLNNLLTVVGGFTQLARQHHTDPERLFHDLDQVEAARRQASDLTHRLLRLARREDPTGNDWMDLNATLVDGWPILRPLVRAPHRLVLKSGVVKPIRLDRAALMQIVLNLISNARDALPLDREGVVEVETALEATSPERVLLVVRDNGTGMTEAISAQVFEPLFTTKSAANGTGLGLTTVRRLVERAGGTIDLASRPDEGTTVTVRFPAREMAPDGAATLP